MLARTDLKYLVGLNYVTVTSKLTANEPAARREWSLPKLRGIARSALFRGDKGNLNGGEEMFLCSKEQFAFTRGI